MFECKCLVGYAGVLCNEGIAGDYAFEYYPSDTLSEDEALYEIELILDEYLSSDQYEVQILPLLTTEGAYEVVVTFYTLENEADLADVAVLGTALNSGLSGNVVYSEPQGEEQTASALSTSLAAQLLSATAVLYGLRL
jgi:hypothetical protein